jgi:hypothetical protein
VTIPQAMQEMLLAASPACRAKLAPFARVILEQANHQEQIIEQLATRPRVIVALTAMPADTKISDA